MGPHGLSEKAVKEPAVKASWFFAKPKTNNGKTAAAAPTAVQLIPKAETAAKPSSQAKKGPPSLPDLNWAPERCEFLSEVSHNQQVTAMQGKQTLDVQFPTPKFPGNHKEVD